MSEPVTRSDWLTANGEFLAVSIAWLREVLRHHGQAGPEAPAEPPGRSRDELSALAAAAEDAAQSTPPPALVSLAQRVGLTRFERDVLLLCAAAELDPSVRVLYADVHGNEAMTYPTFALAMTVLPDPAWEALSPEGALREWRLIDIHRPWGESLISSPLRTDERIVNHLKGLDHLDARLNALLQPVPPAYEQLLPTSHLAAVEQVARRLVDGPVVQLVGPDRASAMVVASAAAARAGRQLCVMPAAVLPQSPDELDELARLWRRESALSPVALDATGTSPPHSSPGWPLRY